MVTETLGPGIDLHRESVVRTDATLENFREQVEFLSQITGLPVVSSEYAAEDVMVDEGGVFVSYDTKIHLGNEKEEYQINVNLEFSDEHTPGEPLPTLSWDVRHNGVALNRPQRWIYGTFDSSKFYDSKKLHDYLWSDFRHAVGRPDTEIAFMDFETYTVESLMGDHDYFANIYLTLMTHMKARGLPMPPILGKVERIHSLMEKGAVEELEGVMKAFIGLEGGYLDTRCRSHMEYEAREILETAKWERDARDPSIPLEQSFPSAEVRILEGQSEKFRRVYTILVAENDLDNPGDFEGLVTQALENDGRWKGSKLVTEVNLSACMHFCATNKIDLVLFDWRNPSGEEVVQIGSGKVNPMYKAFYGNSLAHLNAENGEVTLADGRTLAQDDLNREAERLDIRNVWMDNIARFCDKKGVIPPLHYIVRDGRDEKELAEIVARKLNR